MSNRRRLPGSRPPLPHCGACGRAIPKAMASSTLSDGRVICGRCIEAGVLCQRLPCGHYGIPGMTVVADSADQSNFQCPRCTPHAVPVTLTAART